jgi:K+/H+ antiporter YhaU regulatory subunit KhtT
LRADEVKVVVESRGTRREYEAVSLLRRADRRFRRLTVRAGSQLAGTTLGAARVRERYDAAVVAVRTAGGWSLAPSGETTLSAGDELFAVGTADALDGFAGALSAEGGGD